MFRASIAAPTGCPTFTPDFLTRTAELLDWNATPTGEQKSAADLALVQKLVAARWEMDEGKQLGY